MSGGDVDERLGEDRAETPVERLSEGGAATGPSGPAYATLAEGHRRAGRAHEAESLARAGLRVFPGGTSGRLALALALLDQRRIEEARREVEGLLESLAEFQAARGALAALIGESEPASDEPEPDVDAAMDAWAEEPAVEEEDVLLAEGSSPFATETMAGLLERQGHAEDARALRARLDGAAPTPSAAPEPAPASSPIAFDDDAFVLPEPEPMAAAETESELADEPLAAAAEPFAPFGFEREEPLAEFVRAPEHAPEPAFADDLRENEPAPPADAMAARRAQVISTLERWLENLRRGVA